MPVLCFSIFNRTPSAEDYLAMAVPAHNRRLRLPRRVRLLKCCAGPTRLARTSALVVLRIGREAANQDPEIRARVAP